MLCAVLQAERLSGLQLSAAGLPKRANGSGWGALGSVGSRGLARPAAPQKEEGLGISGP